MNYFRYIMRTMEFTVPLIEKRGKSKQEKGKYQHIKAHELIDKVQSREPNEEEYIGITGVFSEFVPILDISLLFPRYASYRPPSERITHFQVPLMDLPKYSLPVRLKPIMGRGIGGLYSMNSSGVYDECIPLFYGQRLFKLQRGTTGNIVNVIAKIIDIPERWSKLFVNNTKLSFSDSFDSTLFPDASRAK